MSGYGPENTPLKRFDVKNLKDEILKSINLEKGILYTVVNLAIRPGQTLKTYLFEDRRKMIKPLPFLLLTVAIATFLTVNFLDMDQAFGIADGTREDMSEQELAFSKMYTEKFTQFYNFLMLVTVPFLAFGQYILYRKYRYNFAEHLVIAAYLTAMMDCIYIIFFPIFMVDYGIASLVLVGLFMIYATIVLIQVFNERIGPGIWKGIGVQVIYYFSFFVVMLIFLIILAVVFAFNTKGG